MLWGKGRRVGQVLQVRNNARWVLLGLQSVTAHIP